MEENDLEIEMDVEEVLAPPAQHIVGGAEACTLPPQFARMMDVIEHDRLRNLVTHIYVRQLKALATLEAIERILTDKGASDASRPFGVLRRQCAGLLAYLGDALESADFLDEDMRDTLDGMRFVISHEMAKVFRADFNSPAGARQSRAELTRSWGLLNNCLQQAAIALAQAFDPAACGEEMFADYQSKVENSLALYRDLNALLNKVERARNSSGILLKHSLIRYVELFREETMHFLMYKDWAEFQNFVEKLKGAFEEVESFDGVLHEFALYLDTLIHHVGMREVLRRSGANGMREDDAPPPRGRAPRVGQPVG
jgi:hypothetical protein